MNRTLDVLTSYFASGLTLGAGLRARKATRMPEKMLELYEFEQCPFSRKAREALSELDLDALIKPCPPKGKRWRDELAKRGGKVQVPYLVDPNTGREMYESDEVIHYLATTYGDGGVPLFLRPSRLNNLRATLPSLPRMMNRYACPSRQNEKPLELYSFEVSPYCRIAREALCRLELSYVLYNVAKGSSKREAFVRLSGKMMVPFLVDPNTGTSMFESGNIVRYLEETYSA